MQMKVILGVAILIGGVAFAVAQTDHSGHGDGTNHAAHGQADGTALTEPGQGAFAALSEVVTLLEADPATDWSQVDLRGLRDHLVDMDRLVSFTEVEEEPVDGGLRMIVTGDAQTLAALRRMVPAHAGQLANDPRWTVDVTQSVSTVELIVTSDDPAVAARIRGLGFFGLMASQDHHSAHHLMMARGEDAHAH
ncbi:hypothetical protein [Sulfitobacter pacificus]|uniref:Uncharacterized protein n=1 Tax=Sulfitobacter pacificus TaxID=1499314 RepID=A0ABQ5VPT8_9RHOB|nr:hypothetical protein [Sulfitobacter pacificus]GLQ28927.1 hypothetical protein GCM10007927_37300 [Sulfitobacter pacificus]